MKEINPTFIMCFVALTSFMAKELYSLFRNKQKELSENLSMLNSSVIRLTLQIEYLQKGLQEIPELRKDLDNLGQKVRDMDKPRS